METKPTHEQGQLHLQVYDLRREPRLRQARDWFQKNYRPESFDDAMKIAPMGTENGINMGMVFGYWEQACALLNYGLLHDGLFFETSGEFFNVWEAIKPIVPECRQRFNDPNFLGNLEKAAQRFEAWSEQRAPGHLAAVRQMMQQMRSQSSAAAGARSGSSNETPAAAFMISAAGVSQRTRLLLSGNLLPAPFGQLFKSLYQRSAPIGQFIFHP